MECYEMKHLLTMLFLLLVLTAAAAPENGAVCFTFDDYYGANWLKADKIFKKYNAHVTFFVVKDITPEKLEVMKKLQAAGHSIGLHTMHHRNADRFIKSRGEKWYFENEVKPQLDACAKSGLVIRSFAYPNNRRNEQTDKMLYKYFDYLRAGNGPAKKPIYYKLSDVKDKMVLGGGGIGVFYKSDLDELKSRLDKASKENRLIVFFSHNIAPKAKGIHMPTEMLEALLDHANKLGMKIIGFNELKELNQKK